MSGVFPARTGGFAARRHYGIAVFTQRRRPRELLQAVSRTHMKPAPAIYATPHKPHEWWRGTLPTVPRDDDWEAVIKQVERVAEGVSLVVLDGVAPRELHLPSPDNALFGIQICLEGNLELTHGGGRSCLLSGGMAMVFHHPVPACALWRLPAGQSIRLVDIRFTLEALCSLGWSHLPGRVEHRFAGPDGGGAVAFSAAFATPSACVDLAWALASDAPVSDAFARRAWRWARIQEALALVADTICTPLPLQRPTDKEYVAIVAAGTLLRQNCAEAWTPRQLARRVGIPEKKLQAGFRAYFGTSVHAYLRDLRLTEAAAMLDRGCSVTQSAVDTGFSSQSHFGKVFRQRYGLGPKDWARRSAVRVQTTVQVVSSAPMSLSEAPGEGFTQPGWMR